MRYILVFTMLLAYIPQIMGQKQMDMADILDEWVSSGDSSLIYQNINLTAERLNTAIKDSPFRRRSPIWKYLHLKGSVDTNNVAQINKTITFKNVKSGPLFLENIHLKNLIIEESTFQSIRFDSLFVDSLEFDNINILEGFRIYFSHISNYLWIRVNSKASGTISKSAVPSYININRSTLDKLFFTQVWAADLNQHLLWRKDSVPWGTTDTPYITKEDFLHHPPDEHAIAEDHYKFNFSSNHISDMRISRSILPKHHIRVYSNLEKIAIRQNILGAVSIYSDAIFSELLLKNNRLTTGLILNKHLAEVLFEISWLDVANKLRIGTDTLFYPTSHEVVSNINHYEAMSKAYSSLHNYYKSIGMLTYMNACYIQWKDMQSERFKYIYNTQGGFENYFKWKLNTLLRIYTRYGTSPAQAIVMSIYLILGFTVFYYFFPSDWDVASKKKLISDYRDFIQKNKKGYVKPFFRLLGGFIVSLVNALTLSLNSFITLGFGVIPTRGLARYVCIIQGFIGWFLLSIFTVSLINQILG